MTSHDKYFVLCLLRKDIQNALLQNTQRERGRGRGRERGREGNEGEGREGERKGGREGGGNADMGMK